MANINIRTDESLKKNAEILFSELGLNLTTAINIFLRQSVYERKIPFEITRDITNLDTIQALEEGKKLAIDDSADTYSSLEDFQNAMEKL